MSGVCPCLQVMIYWLSESRDEKTIDTYHRRRWCGIQAVTTVSSAVLLGGLGACKVAGLTWPRLLGPRRHQQQQTLVRHQQALGRHYQPQAPADTGEAPGTLTG